MTPPGVVFLVGFLSFAVGTIIGSVLTMMYVMNKYAEVQKEVIDAKKDYLEEMNRHQETIKRTMEYISESRKVLRGQEENSIRGLL